MCIQKAVRMARPPFLKAYTFLQGYGRHVWINKQLLYSLFQKLYCAQDH